MNAVPPPLLCVDIGNTHTHFGVISGTGLSAMASMPSRELAAGRNLLTDLLGSPAIDANPIAGLACCSVVPALTPRLQRAFSDRCPRLPFFELTHQARLGLPLSYPAPETIGPDRLANAVAAQALFGPPAIIVDAGTAVTCDVITPEGGFEGGIIAPGVGLMRHYLHEKTALLPLLEEEFPVTRSIGKSTIEAMQIGCRIGFDGMVDSLLAALRRELAARDLTNVTVILTGGSAHLLAGGTPGGAVACPELTLRGLRLAFLLNRVPAPGLQPGEAGPGR